MTERPASILPPILRGVAVTDEPLVLGHPSARQRREPEPPVPEAAPVVAAIDSSELDRLREAAFRDGLERGQAKGFEEGLKQGFGQGLTEGRQEGEAVAFRQVRDKQDRLDFLTERLEQWLSLLPDHFQEQLAVRLKAGEDEMVALCQAVICRFLGEKLLSREAILQGVRSAVTECCGPGSQASPACLLAIHVHPRDLELLQSDPALSDWLSRLRAGPIPWRPDEAVALGGCIVHSTQGSLDARLETQFAALRELLLSGRGTNGVSR